MSKSIFFDRFVDQFDFFLMVEFWFKSIINIEMIGTTIEKESEWVSSEWLSSEGSQLGQENRTWFYSLTRPKSLARH